MYNFIYIFLLECYIRLQTWYSIIFCWYEHSWKTTKTNCVLIFINPLRGNEIVIKNGFWGHLFSKMAWRKFYDILQINLVFADYWSWWILLAILDASSIGCTGWFFGYYLFGNTGLNSWRTFRVLFHCQTSSSYKWTTLANHWILLSKCALC